MSKTYLKNLKTLIAMQLREKLSGTRKKDRKALFFKIMLPVFAFILLTVFAFLLFYFTYAVNIFESYIPVNVLTFIFSLTMILSIAFTAYSLVKNLYFSFDNQILLTFPVSSGQVFLSKLVVFYILELRRTVNYVLPLFIAFGIINSLSAGYFFVLPFAFILISLVSFVIAAFLSIPFLFIILFLQRVKVLQFILAVAATSLGVFLVLRLINLIPYDIDFWGRLSEYVPNIHNFFERPFGLFQDNPYGIFMIFDLLAEMVTGRVAYRYHTAVTSRSVAIFFSASGIALVLITAAFFLIRPLFFVMVSKHRENKQTVRKKQKKNIKLKSYFSILKKEALLRFRTPAALSFTLIGLVILPVAIFLLNRVYSAFDTADLGNLVILVTNFFILMLIITSQNIRAASIFSSEGKAMYLLKTTPDTVKANIGAKMFFDTLLASVSLLITVIIIANSVDLPRGMAYLIFFSVLSFMVGHICWSVEMDITNPQYLKIIDGVHESSNANENKSMIIALLLSFLVAVVATFLMMQDIYSAWYRIALIAAAFVSIRTYLLITNIKVYFKEM